MLVLGYGENILINNFSKIFQVVPAFLTIPNYLSLSLTPSPEINTRGENITVWRLQVSLSVFSSFLLKKNNFCR